MPRNFYTHCAYEPRRKDDVPHNRGLFPLTPALGERGNRRQTFGNYDDSSHRMAHGSWAGACSVWNCSRTMNRGGGTVIQHGWLPFPLTPALYCENAIGWENYARADALATPGEGTRPTGVRIYHSRW